ncbi:RICIN domain-containing protein [Streptomyces sp. NPDC001339]|uniref:RICIN domain-containing protein n=1 Tax=Streptomyces sp. NPDC001339 TaxID=3364563 RepID=UPI0036A9E551
MMAGTIRAALAMAGSVAVLAGGATAAHAEERAPRSAAPTAETVVQLQNVQSGKCLEIDNGATANGRRAQQWTCYDTVEAQKWRLVPAADSTFELRSQTSGKCLEVENSGTQAGAAVQQWSCFGGKNTHWRIVLVDHVNKLFQLRPAHVEDRCLDITGAKMDNAVQAQQWSCNQTPAQLWRVKPVK